MGILNLKIDVDMRRAPNAAKMKKQADDVVGAALTEMGLVMERTVKEETPLGATKLLRGSIFSEPRGTPIREVLIASTQIYAPIVERGRQPGKFPPIGPIELWVRRKLGVDPGQSKGVAFVIARSIARKGTKGAAMFYKGFMRGRPVLERLANKIGGTIVAEWEKGP